MGFCMPHYFATFVVILMIREIICPANGQCTIQGCDNRDQLMSIVDEILQLRDELFHRLDKQDQSIREEMKSQLGTLLNMSSKAVDRCPLERDICREQFQGMLHEVFNESFQEMKSQHDAIVTSLQSVEQRLKEHDISIRNQTQNSIEKNGISIRNQTQNSIEEHDISIRNQTQNSIEENGISIRNQTLDPREFANDNCGPASEMCDCSDIKANGQNRSGVYEVCVGHQLNRTCTSAFCDMETANGASLVFQRRKDGSVKFNRTWTEYREGFGNPDGEFWLGNEMLYLLTSKRNYKLRVDLERFEGDTGFAEYSTFSISSSADNYRLTIGGYSGTAGASLDHNNREEFTTIDVDNDEYSDNCARVFGGGGWWYGSGCFNANLNGKYYQRNESFGHATGIHWYHWHNTLSYSLKATEMKLVLIA